MIPLFDYSDLFRVLRRTRMAGWADVLPDQIAAALHCDAHGDLPRWIRAVENLPVPEPERVYLKNRFNITGNITDAQQAAIELQLRELHPWRKGPYTVYGIHIDTEWRSDWKWDRLKPHVSPLKGRTVLDIGCGNGYHCWRMAGEGARLAVGIDPSKLFTMQYWAMRRLAGPRAPAWVLPLGIEHLPARLTGFDTVFSMGVLYHRKDPGEHLRQLRKLLRRGGELVLETLVIDGLEDDVISPPGRYAKMRNVWMIPSCPALVHWLRDCGFKDIRIVDVTVTSTDEQRTTDWMRFQSLPDFLDPHNPMLTIEGYPAPKRAVVIARN